MHWDIGGYTPGDIEPVCAFDLDRRKVSTDLSNAIFADPNCTTIFQAEIPSSNVRVRMGRVLDGNPLHMEGYKEAQRFAASDETEPTEDDVVSILRDSGAEIS